VVQSQQRGRDVRGGAKQAWWAWRKAEQMFDAAVQAEAAATRIETALALFRPEGCLSDRQWAQGHIRAALAELDGQEWGKVRRLLSDQRTLNHLDWMHEQLAQAVPEPLLREACTRLWYWRETMTHTHGHKRARLAQVVVMEQVVCQRLHPEWQQAYERVEGMLGHVVRARSAVECVNRVVRMHQARHRHVSQGMLDLKRLYWNCRVFRHGKRQWTCPYALLGLQLPIYDWWQLLQTDPKELEQPLSTQEVTV
jgi:hypothetical protein